MHKLKQCDLSLISGGTGPAGGTVVPVDPPREAKKQSPDGSYTPPPKTEEGD
jgi:hypothetical protein